MKSFITGVFQGLSILCFFHPFAYWWQNEGLSQMQVFKDCWTTIALSVLFSFIAWQLMENQP
jgi:hypothetical protein